MVSVPAPVAQNAVPVIPTNRTVEKPSDTRTEVVQAVKKNQQTEGLREDSPQTRSNSKERGSVVDIVV